MIKTCTFFYFAVVVVAMVHLCCKSSRAMNCGWIHNIYTLYLHNLFYFYLVNITKRF